MEIKAQPLLSKQFLCALIAFLLSAVQLFCQEKQFTQKLAWQADPNAFEYKVEIKNAGSSSVLKTIETEKSFVEFSMPAGEYTYRIFTYDFLGRQASVTEWKRFSIKKALKPEIRIKSEAVSIEPDGTAPVKIPADVDKITPNSKAAVINEETGERIEGKIEVEKSGGEIVSGSVVVSGLKEGNWKVVIQNPSGLYSESAPITVKTQEKPAVAKSEETAASEAEAAEEILAEQPGSEEADALAKTDSAASEKEIAALPDTSAGDNAEVAETGADSAAEIAPGLSGTESEPPVQTEIETGSSETELAVLDTAAEQTEQENEEQEGEEQEDDSDGAPKAKKGYSAQDITILAQFVAPFIFYGEDIKNCTDSAFNWGVGAKIAWLPIDIGSRKTVQLGLELGGTATKLSMNNSGVSVALPMLLAQGNVVSRINFGSGKLGLNIKLGAGVSFIKESVSYTGRWREPSETGYYGHICANGGLSLSWIAFRHLMLEAGADFTNIFIPNMNTGMLNAYVGIGLRF